MNKILAAVLASGLAVPGLAQAATTKPVPVEGAEQAGEFQPSGAYVQAFYNPSSERTLKGDIAGVSGEFDDSGDGYGVEGYLPFALSGYGLFVNGEYSTVNYDENDAENTQWRAGVGLTFSEGFSIYAQWADFDFSNDQGDSEAFDSDGYGAHVGYSLPLFESPFTAYAEVGYLWLTTKGPNEVDLEGFEYKLGGSYNITTRFAGFIDYRFSDLELDTPGDDQVEVGDFHAGVRLAF